MVSYDKVQKLEPEALQCTAYTACHCAGRLYNILIRLNKHSPAYSKAGSHRACRVSKLLQLLVCLFVFIALPGAPASLSLARCTTSDWASSCDSTTLAMDQPGDAVLTGTGLCWTSATSIIPKPNQAGIKLKLPWCLGDALGWQANLLAAHLVAKGGLADPGSTPKKISRLLT